jgi:hypothetical protein
VLLFSNPTSAIEYRRAHTLFIPILIPLTPPYLTSLEEKAKEASQSFHKDGAKTMHNAVTHLSHEFIHQAPAHSSPFRFPTIFSSS